ncbi:MAG: serine protease [Bacteroidota bacterium]|nr:serine protease [Bacteroidota bacterium]
MKKFLLILFVIASINSFAQNPWDGIFEKYYKTVFSIRTIDADGNDKIQGVGFFIDYKGLAFSCAHILEKEGEKIIVTHDNRRYPIKEIIAKNEKTDIVKFLIENKDKDSLSHLKIANHAPYENDEAFSIGIFNNDSMTFDYGYVSTVRMFKDVGEGILLTLPIFENNNGGPLLNSNGRLVGILSLPLAKKFEMNFALSLENFEKLKAVEKENEIDSSQIKLTHQELVEKYGKYYDSLKNSEIRFQSLGDSIIDGWNMFVRMDALTDFIPHFKDVLEIPGSYDFPFDSFGFIKILNSPDNKFRIFNWTLKFDNEEYRYYGAIQFNNLDSLELVPLFDGKKHIEFGMEEDTFLSNENWYGVQYFDMKYVKTRKTEYYILLGWDGNNSLSDKKVIEILTFNDKMPVFGAPVFKVEGETKYRQIFEYNDEALMVLNFNEERDMIIFDNLIPKDKKDKGREWLYVPDGTYNGFQIKKGKLIFKEMVLSK